MLLIANKKLTTQVAITSLFVSNKLMLTCCHLFAVVRIIIHVSATR